MTKKHSGWIDQTRYVHDLRTDFCLFSVHVIQRAFQLSAILLFNGYQYVIATLFSISLRSLPWPLFSPSTGTCAHNTDLLLPPPPITQ